MAYRQEVPAYADPRGITGVLQDIRENYPRSRWRGLALGFLRFAKRYMRLGKKPDSRMKARFYARLAEELIAETAGGARALPRNEQLEFEFVREAQVSVGRTSTAHRAS